MAAMDAISRTSVRALLVTAVLSVLLVGCELEETLTFNADGSGTYLSRFTIYKQFASAIDELKAKVTAQGYTVVEESETAEAKILVFKKDFREVSELSADFDRISLSVEEPELWKRSYSLNFSVDSSAASGLQKRTIKVVFPVAITTASAGAVDGREVVWDGRGGGTFHVEAVGFILPFGITAVKAGVGLALLFAAVFVLVRSRRRAPTCTSCGATDGVSGRFCVSCGGTLGERRTITTAAGVTIIGVLLLGAVVANRAALSALVTRVTAGSVTEASMVPPSPITHSVTAPAESVAEASMVPVRSTTEGVAADANGEATAVHGDASLFAGVWSYDGYQFVEIAPTGDKFRIRECYGLDASGGTEYTASLYGEKLVVEGEASTFYKLEVPTFSILPNGKLLYAYGAGPVELERTMKRMPAITYGPPEPSED